MTGLDDLEPRIAAGESLTRVEAERLAASPDLLTLGMLGELARKRRHGDRITFVRVCVVTGDGPASALGEAGEVRLSGAPASLDEARSRVQEAVRFARGLPVTGFSVADLLRLAAGDLAALAEAARVLRADGLEAVADVPLDELGDAAAAEAAVRAVTKAGLGAWTATLTQAAFADRLGLIAVAASVHQQTGAFRAFAPLPRVDPTSQPATGYDDVKTIALARLMCGDVPSIQVDWRMYGPKLAQVAIAYGADDLDGVSSVAVPDLGHRRSPCEEIERHIRMAGGEPVERDGRYERRA